MKRNKKWFYIAASLSIMIIISAYAYAHQQGKKDELLKVDVNSFKTGKGWGYEIKVDGKTFIHQESIPAIAGNIVFANKEDAVTTGNAVMKKLLKGRLPALSPQEVMALGIHTTP